MALSARSLLQRRGAPNPAPPIFFDLLSTALLLFS